MVKIGDYVWEDTDCDGVQDGSESGVAGVTLTLYRDGETTPLATTTTDPSGWYEFELVQGSGDYYVVADLPTGAIFSPADQAVYHSDSDISEFFVDGSGNVSDTRGRTAAIDADSNHDYRADVGLCYPADTIQIGDYVWEDTNCDGVQDSSESGIQGVTISLYRKDENDTPYLTTTSDAAGLYALEVPKNSGDYHVVAHLPAGYIFSPGDIAGADIDSDIVAYFEDASGVVDYSRGRANNGNAQSNDDRLNRGDVGLCPDTNMGTIGDYVWYDTNDNGQQNGGESGFANIRVQLYCVNESEVCFETETDASGAYHFDVWPGRDYRVWVELPSNAYDFSSSSSPANSPNNNDIEVTFGDWGRTDNISIDAAGGDYTNYADAGITDD
jgi:hypothetical protein